MAFHALPDPGDPGEPQVHVGRLGGAPAGLERRIVRDRAQVIARGAAICPACELPVSIPSPVAASAPLDCAFCAHQAPARSFVRAGVVDTAANDVSLVARLG